MSKKAVRTAAQVLAQQKADHENPPRESGTVAKAAPASLAVPDNPWTEISTELDKYLGAPLLKFTKQGEFSAGETDTVPGGTRCIAHVDEVAFGWVKWVDNKIVDRRMGRAADRYRPPLRAELDDTNEAVWEKQDDGTRRDPWQFQAALPITRLDTSEAFSFTTGSKGGLNAVNKLVRVYGARVAKEKFPGLPVIELRPDSYKHRQYGKIFYPVLHIVNWTDAAGAPLSVGADLNDSIGL